MVRQGALKGKTPMRKLLLVLAGSILIAAAPPQGEGYLTADHPAGFIVGNAQSNAQMAITEEVPAGETVDRWTRMITSQFFAGLSKRTTPHAFLDGLKTGLAEGCGGAKTSAIDDSAFGEHPAARMRADCPLNPKTGQPESFWILVVAGPENFHVRQVAFRKVPDAADAAWATRLLMNAKWCAGAATNPTC
jgi:hypothetical protein